MNFKTCFKVKNNECSSSIALLILRVSAGSGMFLHGWGKTANPMGWLGAESSVPSIVQLLTVVGEVGGGLAWILGFLVPLASMGLIPIMIGAALTHMLVFGDPFVGAGPSGGSYELAVLYLSIAIILLAFGPGKFSLDKKIF